MVRILPKAMSHLEEGTPAPFKPLNDAASAYNLTVILRETSQLRTTQVSHSETVR